MAIWKEIRKALNNTLGTNNFKPLNEQINTHFEQTKAQTNEQTKTIESYILRNKRFIPSSNTLMIWDNYFELISTTAGVKKVIGTFKPYISGFANIVFSAYTLHNGYCHAIINIYEEDTLKRTQTVYTESSTEEYTFENFEFMSGKQYKFEFVAQTDYADKITRFNYLKLNADLIDGFPYDYTIGG